MVEKPGTALALAALVIALSAGAILFAGLPDSPSVSGAFQENFSTGFLDAERWVITRQGDAREQIVDVVAVGFPENRDYRLQLGLDTLGTRDDTVKFLGVRSVQSANLESECALSVDLDWNNQTNGCYLTASVYLCPTITDENPEDEPCWLKFEYLGVPPGQHARAVIAAKADGTVRYLSTEGWPDQREGRSIGYQRISIAVHEGRIRVSENGTELYRSPDGVVPFTAAYIYLQMSSHSNYPLRVVTFDNVVTR